MHQAQYTTGTQLQEPRRTREKDEQKTIPQTKSTIFFTFIVANLWGWGSARTDPAEHPWKMGGLRLSALEAEEIWAR